LKGINAMTGINENKKKVATALNVAKNNKELLKGGER